MTPVFSTVINFTLKGILERIHKLNYLASIESCDDIIFPRVKRRLLQVNEETEATFCIPTLEDLEACILKAKYSAIQMIKDCGMTITSFDEAITASGTTMLIENAVLNDQEDEASIPVQEEEQELTQVEVNMIKEDMSVLRLKKIDKSGIPTYSPSTEKGSSSKKSYVASRQSKSPFVQYKGAYIRKSTALYILQENCQLSNDRLLRVRSEQPSHLFSGIDQQSALSSNVRIGDLCVFRRVDCDRLLLGRVIQFSYLTGSKKQRSYSSTYVDMSIESFKEIGVYCNYFARSNSAYSDTIPFVPLDLVFTAGYLTMENHVCTILEKHVTASTNESVSFEIPICETCQLLQRREESIESLSFLNEFSQ